MRVHVCGDDKRDTVTHWQILKIKLGERWEEREGVEIRNRDKDYHNRAQ